MYFPFFISAHMTCHAHNPNLYYTDRNRSHGICRMDILAWLCCTCIVPIVVPFGIGRLAGYKYTSPHHRLRRIFAVTFLTLSLTFLLISWLAAISASIDWCEGAECDNPAYLEGNDWDWTEAWLQIYIPPALNRECFTGNPEICTRVHDRRLTSSTWGDWFRNTATIFTLALIPTLITTASAFYATRKRPVSSTEFPQNDVEVLN